MYIYYFFITCIFIIYIFLRELKIKYIINREKILFLVSSILLTLIMGLKNSSVGADWNQYLYRYNSLEFKGVKSLIRDNTEWGFDLLTVILKNIGVNNQGYIFIIGLIISFSFGIFFYKYSNNVFLSFFLHVTIGVFTMSMSGVRQTLAICITMVAFNSIINRRSIEFFFYVFFASVFHKSALCFLIVYFIKNIQLNKRKKILSLILVSSTFFFRSELGRVIQELGSDKYSGYYDSYIMNNHVNPLVVVIAFLIPLTCLLFECNDNDDSIVFKMSLVNLFFNIVSLNINIAGRLSFYFVTYNIIYITNTIESFKCLKLKLLAVYVCIVLTFFQFCKTTPNGTLKIDKYSFFWQISDEGN